MTLRQIISLTSRFTLLRLPFLITYPPFSAKQRRTTKILIPPSSVTKYEL
jgi:hypothetical protein